MNIGFSASTLGFYPIDDKDIYPNWPSDVVEISGEDHAAFCGQPPTGKVLGSSGYGYPAWVDRPERTFEQLIEAAELEKTSRINSANDYINLKQWPSKLALGRLSDDEKILFNQWLDYLDSVYDLDISEPNNISWPSEPEG